MPVELVTTTAIGIPSGPVVFVAIVGAGGGAVVPLSGKRIETKTKFVELGWSWTVVAGRVVEIFEQRIVPPAMVICSPGPPTKGANAEVLIFIESFT